ncbi:transcriptional regulator family: Fungal Specific TF [Aspergillus niger]|nr:transcriptional regulator family: Fungal Specific TF [Aspergillus niger]KAI2867051.1 transcriptional regulator family: Fungal Specific TF [Aspergillus niger]KAI3032182.1 transcriptional regulator family: Fungal Specific TF [Aspergillus niger]
MKPLAPALRPKTADSRRPFSANVSEPPIFPRQKASTACRECKRMRCKVVSLLLPTHAFLTLCVFDLDEDMRRKLFHKRKLNELEAERDFLQQLVNTLRDSSDDKALQLLGLIRSQAPPAELQLYIENAMTDGDRQQSPVWADIPPVYHVPAEPWTSVSKSDDFVSYLVSLWLTWSQPFHNWIDPDLFLRDARTGNLSSQYCSPFLMNCILTEACFYSDHPEAYADPTDRNSKGLHFYEEAKRLYDRVDGQHDLPTLQGCGVFTICKAALGKGQAAWWHLGQLPSLAADFTEKHPLLATLTPQGRAANNAIWGIYNLSVTTSITWMKHLAITQPDRPRLPYDHGPDKAWTPYPRQASPVQSHIACVFNNLCELSTINMYASALVFGSGQIPPPDSLARILQKIQARLDRWRDNLPECLTLENVTVPHALTLHMVYHASIMILWGLLKEPGDAAKAGTESMTFAAREVCVDAAESVVQLLRIYRAKWGIDYMCLTTVSCLSTALFTLLSELGDLGRGP